MLILVLLLFIFPHSDSKGPETINLWLNLYLSWLIILNRKHLSFHTKSSDRRLKCDLAMDRTNTTILLKGKESRALFWTRGKKLERPGPRKWAMRRRRKQNAKAGKTKDQFLWYHNFTKGLSCTNENVYKDETAIFDWFTCCKTTSEQISLWNMTSHYKNKNWLPRQGWYSLQLNTKERKNLKRLEKAQLSPPQQVISDMFQGPSCVDE